MRSIFLILLFPRIINFGRHLMKRTSSPSPEDSDDSSISTADTQLPTEPGDFDTAAGEQTDVEPTKPLSSAHHREVGHFDLIFLRWSLVVDGALTTVVAFATKRWHIYLGKTITIEPTSTHGNTNPSLCSCVPPTFRVRLCAGCQRRHHRYVLRVAACGCPKRRNPCREHCPIVNTGAIWICIFESCRRGQGICHVFLQCGKFCQTPVELDNVNKRLIWMKLFRQLQWLEWPSCYFPTSHLQAVHWLMRKLKKQEKIKINVTKHFVYQKFHASHDIHIR